jgi:hypothetical protein
MRWPRPADAGCRSCGTPATTGTACEAHWVDCLNELLEEIDEDEETGVRVVELMPAQ